MKHKKYLRKQVDGEEEEEEEEARDEEEVEVSYFIYLCNCLVLFCGKIGFFLVRSGFKNLKKKLENKQKK